MRKINITGKKPINLKIIPAILLLSLMLLLLSCDNASSNADNPVDDVVGGDWRTWRGYTQEYVLSDNLTVCFSPLGDVDGYGVYDASGGFRIGNLVFESYSRDDISEGVVIEDCDGDGINDIGISAKDGATLWYRYDPAAESWSEENTNGYFSYIGTDKAENIASDDEIDNSETEIGVMTQEYVGDNIAEILMIRYDGQQPVFEQYNWKNPEIEMINLTIKSGIQQIYNDFMNIQSEREWIEIKSYPFTSDEWLQIVTTHIVYPTYGTDGNMESYNFNKKENRYVTVYDAISDLGLTEESLAVKVRELYVPEISSMSVGEVKATGFLIWQGVEKPLTQLLLEVMIENSEAEPWKRFFAYIHDSGELYELNNYCLFDPYDMDEMTPPLSYQKAYEYDGVSLDEGTAMDLLREALSDKIAEMQANAIQGVNVAIVAYGQEIINGNECWTFALGADSPEKFTAEEHYAVSKGGIIYLMNILNEGKYEEYATP